MAQEKEAEGKNLKNRLELIVPQLQPVDAVFA